MEKLIVYRWNSGIDNRRYAGIGFRAIDVCGRPRGSMPPPGGNVLTVAAVGDTNQDTLCWVFLSKLTQEIQDALRQGVERVRSSSLMSWGIDDVARLGGLVVQKVVDATTTRRVHPELFVGLAEEDMGLDIHLWLVRLARPGEEPGATVPLCPNGMVPAAYRSASGCTPIAS